MGLTELMIGTYGSRIWTRGDCGTRRGSWAWRGRCRETRPCRPGCLWPTGGRTCCSWRSPSPRRSSCHRPSIPICFFFLLLYWLIFESWSSLVCSRSKQECRARCSREKACRESVPFLVPNFRWWKALVEQSELYIEKETKYGALFFFNGRPNKIWYLSKNVPIDYYLLERSCTTQLTRFVLSHFSYENYVSFDNMVGIACNTWD